MGGGDCAHHEDAQDARPSEAGARGLQPAATPLQARSEADQKAHRGPHRTRVLGARRGQQQRVQISGVRSVRACGAEDGDEAEMERPDAEGRGANECRAETAQEVAAMWAPWTVRITYRMCTRGVSARGKTVSDTLACESGQRW